MAVLSLAACTGSDSPEAAKADGASTAAAQPRRGDPDVLSRKVLWSQQRALSRGHTQRFMATWAASVGARQKAREIATNLRALDASVLALRASSTAPVDHFAPASGRTTVRGWRTGVDVVWRTPEMGHRRVISALTYTFDFTRGRALVTGIRARPGTREPIWLVDSLHVDRRRGGVVAVAATAPAARVLARRLRVARHDVARFLPGRHRGPTAYLPARTKDFEAVLGASARQYGSVAAVTTTVDGSSAPRAPVVIVVNPAVWRRLRPAGAHVVVTHEAVHAATGARTADLPDWVAEGFADYVAVRSAGVSVRVASSAALDRVREHGLPRRLPTSRDFRTTDLDLEATYELSRLVMATIAHSYGRSRLVDFYTYLAANPGKVAGALRRQLGTSQAELTQRWRRLLVRLAGAQ